MMDRVEFKNIRQSIEANGYFVEEVKDEYMCVSHLMDPACEMFLVYPGERCPICGEYLVFSTEADRFMCSGEECLYVDCISAYPKQLPQMEANDNKKYMVMKFRFDEDKQREVNAFIDDVNKLILDRYYGVIEAEFYDDDAMNESTLGLIDDDRE